MKMNWQVIETSISDATQCNFRVLHHFPVAGGSINTCYVIEGKTEKYFIKFNAKHLTDMFSAEAEGLAEIHQSATIRVPVPLCQGETVNQAYLVMECIEVSTGDVYSATKFGEQLAKLHKVYANEFGWYRDNTIGSTPQKNKASDCWQAFYHEQRLQAQIKRAVNQGCRHELKTLGDKLCDNLGVFFKGYQPKPSLLHGDLWSGNYMFDEHANPVIFDPAVYYGDRETDIAMTELFGGFSRDFYRAYEDSFPLDDGYKIRKTLYNLYHVLNHFNLFGGGYQQQVIDMTRKLLSEA